MATTNGTADGRAGFILAAAFAAGLALAVAICGRTLWQPPAEPYFGLDDAPVEPERPTLAVARELPPARSVAGTELRQQPIPERLALGDAPAPIAAAVMSQALPTGGRTEATAQEPRDEAGQPPVAGGATHLLPTPADPGSIVPDVVDPGVVDHPHDPAPPAAALRALAARLQPRQPAPTVEPRAGTGEAPPPAAAADETAAVAPLPGDEWNDPDGVNWTAAPAEESREPEPPRGNRLLSRFAERRAELRGDIQSPPTPGGGRLLERLRSDRRGPRGSDEPPAAEAVPVVDGLRWPVPQTLIDQIGDLVATGGGQPAATWAADTLSSLRTVLETSGPRDHSGAEPLILLGDRVAEGMQVADATPDAALASRVRRAALAVTRRAAVWRAATSCCAEIEAAAHDATSAEVGPGITAACTTAEVARLLESLERFEGSRSTDDATSVRAALRAVAASPLSASRTLDRAVVDHYLSPNVRIVVDEKFVERMLPSATVTTGPLHDFVLGKEVRGTKTVEQSIGVRLSPHASEIRLDLVVHGEVASRTVTDAGAVAIHSRGQSTFTVFKPIRVSAQGLSFGAAQGTASNQSQLADIETSFDAVPLMGPLVRGIARSQHDDRLAEATREVNTKIVTRACREVDQQTEPQFTAIGDRMRERFWKPMERLGLEPTPVSLETASGAATARLRLAAPTQLAAHTPRPRAPADALFSMQVHESSVNNACGRFGLAGRRMSLEELSRTVCSRLGIPPRIPDDLPEGVEITFAAVDPVHVECRDGLVHVRVALDALESGRRNNWYDIVAQVAYRPVSSGMQVLLDREGPVQLSGPGHKGRMEFGLRTIFGKMFPKERPVRLVPEQVASNPRLAGIQAVQAVSADGWLAIALGPPLRGAGTKSSATAARPPDAPQRLLRR